MPQYIFKCPDCGKIIEEYQKIDDTHAAVCSNCNTDAKRVFTPPQTKLNAGFQSMTLGKNVKSQTDYKNEHERWMYMNNLDGDLGNNRKPKDQWIEEKHHVEEQQLEHVRQVDDWTAEDSEKHGWYDSIETFKFNPNEE